jgi:hypothetical protein
MDCFEYARDRRRCGRVTPRWNQTNAALLAVVGLILDHSWTTDRAATELREKVGDDSVPRRATGRVRAAFAEYPSVILRLPERRVRKLEPAFPVRRNGTTGAVRAIHTHARG